MKPTEQSCDLKRIDDYLDERLADGELLEFESHLDVCDSCQIEIQQRAAEPGMWRDAIALLSEATELVSSSELEEPDSANKQKQHALGVLAALSPTDDPEMLGRVGDYEIIGVVGVGGMGAVLKGFDRTLRRVVAIKVMAPHLAGSGSARTRFQREARAAAAITHDNVIDTYGVSETNGLPYLVMPFARGPSLQKRIDQSGPLTALEVVRIGRQIASGLSAAHEQGLVHRDIKPANILLNEGIERLWITDFGVARAMDDASMTQTGVIAGTPQYMSPEQARGEAVDHRSDLFSMGSVLYTACTGRPPFRSEAAYGILRRITDTDPRSIQEINSEAPGWLCAIIERLMAKHPSDRYQNAGEVAELFEGCLAHLQQPTQVELPRCIRPFQDDAAVDDSKSIERKPVLKKELTQSRFSRLQRKGVWTMMASIVLALAGLAAWQVTEPVDIGGGWTGERWKSVSLAKVKDAGGWYNGSFTNASGQRGVLQLEWSRVQRRYNGRWRVGDEQSGSLTLRVRGGEARGAVAVDPDSSVASGAPRLREFSWQRATGAGQAQALSAAPGARPVSLESPIKGRVVRWAKGLRENVRVEKGDFLAELASVDARVVDRLEAQRDAAGRQIQAAQTLVRASNNNLDSAKTIVVAAQAQLKTYKQVGQQMAASAEASVKSAENAVEAKKAELAEYQAARAQAQAQFDRQKTLFEQKVISELKYQQAEREAKEASARVMKAEAQVQVAENEVVARKNSELAKQAKSQADVDATVAQVNRAQIDVAKAEQELARAHIELQEAEKSALELDVKVARMETYTITAPIAGVVTQIAPNTIVKEGDVVCVIVPINESQPPASETKLPVNETDASRVKRQPTPSSTGSGAKSADGVSVARLPRFANSPLTENIDAAFSLGRRFGEIRKQLRGIAKNAPTGAAEALKSDLARAEYEREAAVAILKAQLHAAVKLNNSQSTLADMVKRQVSDGSLNPTSLPPAQRAVFESTAQIRQHELLLNYYTDLAKDEKSSVSDARELAVELLKVQLEADVQGMKFQSNQSKLLRRRFELGDIQIQEVLEAEQAEATAAAEVQKIEALLLYYQKLAGEKSKSSAPSPAAEK